jgi:hypothetical protein
MKVSPLITLLLSDVRVSPSESAFFVLLKHLVIFTGGLFPGFPMPFRTCSPKKGVGGLFLPS